MASVCVAEKAVGDFGPAAQASRSAGVFAAAVCALVAQTLAEGTGGATMAPVFSWEGAEDRLSEPEREEQPDTERLATRRTVKADARIWNP